jgi:hypothetical protein
MPSNRFFVIRHSGFVIPPVATLLLLTPAAGGL